MASVLQDASYELGAIAKRGHCGTSRDQLSWATLLTDAYRHPPKRAALAVGLAAARAASPAVAQPAPRAPAVRSLLKTYKNFSPER